MVLNVQVWSIIIFWKNETVSNSTGHPGEGDIGNFVLQAKGAKVLKVPYVCSGGVGDGKQLVAALALGKNSSNSD